MLHFAFGGASGGTEPWTELEQLPPPPSSSSLLRHSSPPRSCFGKASEGTALTYESALGASCPKGQSFKEGRKHPAREWAGSDFVPHRCGQENENLFPA